MMADLSKIPVAREAETNVKEVEYPVPAVSALSIGFREFIRLSGINAAQRLSDISAQLAEMLTGKEGVYIVTGGKAADEAAKVKQAFKSLGKDVEIKVSRSPDAFKWTEANKVCGIPALLTTENGKTVLYIHEGFLNELIEESAANETDFEKILGPGGLVAEFAKEELAEFEALG